MFSMYRDMMDTCGQEGVMDGETQQQLRLRIYEATIEEFREKGFKFTMDDMARWERPWQACVPGMLPG